MKLNIQQGNLFDLDEDEFSENLGYFFVHCISSDCAMGAGIAVEFERRFKLKQALLHYYSEEDRKFPTCLYAYGVFNLITKQKYWHKPTYDSLRKSIREMLEIIVDNDSINKLAMPKIGSGLDKLNWDKVLEIIIEEVEEFEFVTGRELEIEIRYL